MAEPRNAFGCLLPDQFSESPNHALHEQRVPAWWYGSSAGFAINAESPFVPPYGSVRIRFDGGVVQRLPPDWDQGCGEGTSHIGLDVLLP